MPSGWSGFGYQVTQWQAKIPLFDCLSGIVGARRAEFG